MDKAIRRDRRLCIIVIDHRPDQITGYSFCQTVIKIKIPQLNQLILQKGSLKKFFREQDWNLLVFLLLVLNVKLVIKAAALLVFILIYRKSWREINPLRQQHLYFYFGIAGIGLIHFLLHFRELPASYPFVTALGIAYWLMAAAAAYLLVVIVKRSDPAKIENTITLFFCLHLLFIFGWLIKIMIETQSLNPYTYKGLHQKYFINTGDFIRGVTLDSPLATAFISCFGILYFLYRDRIVLSLCCMMAVLLQVSNLATIIMIAVLLFCLLFYSTRLQKSVIVVSLLLLSIFLARVSPQNGEYMAENISKISGLEFNKPSKKEELKDPREIPDSLLNAEERKRKIALMFIDSAHYGLSLQKDTINRQKNSGVNTEPQFATREDSMYFEYAELPQLASKRNRFADFIANHYSPEDSIGKKYNWDRPGKLIAYKQTYHFLNSHRNKILLGNGMANFSSRLAFKATTLNVAGSYPSRFFYMHPDFRDNHLYIFLHYFSQEEMKHSVMNSPDSVYSQLLGEYGFVGVLLFLVLYIGFFARRIRQTRHSIPLLLLLLAGLSIEYWFEQLSIVILFELLMLVDRQGIRSSSKPGANEYS